MDERPDGEVESQGTVDRVRDAIGSARQAASRSIDLVTGADIRRFDDFTDAATTIVVGLHPIHSHQARERSQEGSDVPTST